MPRSVQWQTRVFIQSLSYCATYSHSGSEGFSLSSGKIPRDTRHVSFLSNDKKILKYYMLEIK